MCARRPIYDQYELRNLQQHWLTIEQIRKNTIKPVICSSRTLGHECLEELSNQQVFKYAPAYSIHTVVKVNNDPNHHTISCESQGKLTKCATNQRGKHFCIIRHKSGSSDGLFAGQTQVDSALKHSSARMAKLLFNHNGFPKTRAKLREMQAKGAAPSPDRVGTPRRRIPPLILGQLAILRDTKGRKKAIEAYPAPLPG